ncbi:hypothetical protein IRJ41_000788 [Triplophysa rosa]|uniref:Uncharacterized protein n=1 Tax=Triplophysa rosa TaxID=992332 RepID=A0A9W7TB86_TRIRA|nr:hypothetical protein IRJ41_000788 [Triplophysa rosa]
MSMIELRFEKKEKNTKEDILNKVGDRAALAPIHFYCMDTKPMQATAVFPASVFAINLGKMMYYSFLGLLRSDIPNNPRNVTKTALVLSLTQQMPPCKSTLMWIPILFSLSQVSICFSFSAGTAAPHSIVEIDSMLGWSGEGERKVGKRDMTELNSIPGYLLHMAFGTTDLVYESLFTLRLSQTFWELFVSAILSLSPC